MVRNGYPTARTVRVKSEGGVEVKMVTEFEPSGDQPTAIKDLVEGLAPAAGQASATSGIANPSADGSADALAEQQTNPNNTQVLLGVTGSGKTFTMAHAIQAVQKPTLILAPNKIAGSPALWRDERAFSPNNAVEYFVSYYDYYQPEAYVPRTDTYIEKEPSAINEQIDRMRHSATRALLGAGRRHHRRLGVLHLRHRFGRKTYTAR